LPKATEHIANEVEKLLKSSIQVLLLVLVDLPLDLL